MLSLTLPSAMVKNAKQCTLQQIMSRSEGVVAGVVVVVVVMVVLGSELCLEECACIPFVYSCQAG